MAKYFNHLDVFVEATITPDYLFVEVIEYPLTMDSDNYWDRQSFKTVNRVFTKVQGNSQNYWVTGNVIRFWKHGNTDDERARNFAVWYHENKSRLVKVDMN